MYSAGASISFKRLHVNRLNHREYCVSELLFNPDFAFNLVGFAGFIVYMLAYGLLQAGKINGQGITYVSLNMLAASLVLISLSNQFNLASALIQIAWIVISIAGLIRSYRSHKKSVMQESAASNTKRACNRTTGFVSPEQKLEQFKQHLDHVRQLNVLVAYQLPGKTAVSTRT